MPRRQTTTLYDIYHNGVFLGVINGKGVVVSTSEAYPSEAGKNALQYLVDQGDKQQRLEIFERGKPNKKDRMFLSDTLA